MSRLPLLESYLRPIWSTSSPTEWLLFIERMGGCNYFVALIIAYVLIRYRIVDARLVVSRSLAYGVLAGSIVAVFAAMNLAFAKEWARFAVVIPLEIVAAVALGYRLSGFSDVATTLSLIQVDAPAAAVLGRPGDEREILARALGRAERTRATGLIAEVRARAAFGAWFAGEDDEFERQLAALEVLIRKRPARGLSFFAFAARGRPQEREPGKSDLSEWIARAYLVGCGTVRRFARRRPLRPRLQLMLGHGGRHLVDRRDHRGAPYAPNARTAGSSQLGRHACSTARRARSTHGSAGVVLALCRRTRRVHARGSVNAGARRSRARRGQRSAAFRAPDDRG